MAKYLVEARYTAEGAKGLAREGGTGGVRLRQKRSKVLGARLRRSTTRSAMSMLMSFSTHRTTCLPRRWLSPSAQSGGINLKTVVLMTPEEMDQAGKKAVDFRPPGR